MRDVFIGGSAASLGMIPAYEWYRDHPSFIDRRFVDEDAGWQYLSEPANAQAAITASNRAYDGMFQSMKFRHAIVTVKNNTTAWRPILSAGQSIFGEL